MTLGPRGEKLDAARLAALAALFVALTAWSWLKWADLRVDSGEELFIPLRLAEGETLYRDVAFIYGPLSKYVAAALFAVGGASVLTLALFDLLVLACFTVFLDRFLQHLADRWTATCGVLVFLGTFAFEQYVVTANYNFVAPYRHEAVHGLMLGFVSLAALLRYAEAPRARLLVACGLALGGTLLTKPESFFSAAAAVGVGLVLMRLTQATSALVTPRAAALLAGSAAFAPLAFTLFFLGRGCSPAAAARGALGAFVPLVDAPAVTGGKFFISSMGLDLVPQRLTEAGLSLAGLLAVTALLVGLDVAARRLAAPARYALGAGLGGALAAGLWTLPSWWHVAPRALPVVCAGAALVAAVLILLRRAQAAGSRPALQVAVLATFALVLLGKMLLYTRAWHFGFYLAMPATLVLVVLWAGRVPAWLAARAPAGGEAFRAGATVVLLAFVGFGLRLSDEFYSAKTLTVGQSPDALMGFDPQRLDADLVVARVLEHLGEREPAGATLVAIPEGSLYNYLTRRRSTVPYTIFTTTELTVYSEQKMLAALAAQPPDIILWVRRNTAELGVGAFGTDPAYGAEIGEWVRANYEPRASFDTHPRSRARYGVDVLHRRTP